MSQKIKNRIAAIFVLVCDSVCIYSIYFAHDGLELLGNNIWTAFGHVVVVFVQMLMFLIGVLIAVWLWTKKTPE